MVPSALTRHDPLLHPKHNIVICRKHMLSACLVPSFTTLQNIQTGNDNEKTNCSPHDTVRHLCTETTWNCFLLVAMYEMSECVAGTRVWINKNSITLKTCLTAFPLHTARKEQKVKENWSFRNIRYKISFFLCNPKKLLSTSQTGRLDFYFGGVGLLDSENNHNNHGLSSEQSSADTSVLAELSGSLIIQIWCDKEQGAWASLLASVHLMGTWR